LQNKRTEDGGWVRGEISKQSEAHANQEVCKLAYCLQQRTGGFGGLPMISSNCSGCGVELFPLVYSSNKLTMQFVSATSLHPSSVSLVFVRNFRSSLGSIVLTAIRGLSVSGREKKQRHAFTNFSGDINALTSLQTHRVRVRVRVDIIALCNIPANTPQTINQPMRNHHQLTSPNVCTPSPPLSLSLSLTHTHH
jgi:hypothetical protein